MNQIFAALAITAAISSGAQASEAPATSAENRCIQAALQQKAVLTNASDSALNGFAMLLPAYAEQIQNSLANPYHCSMSEQQPR